MRRKRTLIKPIDPKQLWHYYFGMAGGNRRKESATAFADKQVAKWQKREDVMRQKAQNKIK